MLLVVGLALALRALAVPLEMTAHPENAPAQTALSAKTAFADHDARGVRAGGSEQQDEPEALAVFDGSDCRERLALAQEQSPTDTRVCQILCAVLGAPLLFDRPVPLAQGTIEACYEVPLPLSLGVALPPDHPPPIA